MHKQIWEITESDILKYPVWHFPMLEDEDSDEATVRPASEEEANNPDTQVIVASEFIDNNGAKYSGYIYWAKPIALEVNQPLMWVKGNPIGFWFGIKKPLIEEMPKLQFPIKAVSKPLVGLGCIEIEISGYGYVNGNEVEYINS